MQATFKIYRVSFDPPRNALILAGKVIKGTIRAGMKVPAEVDGPPATELEIADVETVDRNGTWLCALVLTTNGDIACFLERWDLIGRSILVTEKGGQESTQADS
jgi:hypothetical protein